jgi:hypothetical protein
MVFSNSSGVFLDRDTRVEVRRFQQEPFLPNRTDLEVEPSISQQEVFVSRGAVGVCPARPVPGSTMRYATNLGSINVRGGQMVVESEDHETRFSLISGDVTVTEGDSDTGGTLLQPGQQAVIRRLPGQPPQFFVRPIPEETRPALEEKATMACMARRTVYFDVANDDIDDRSSGGNVFFDEPEGEEAAPEQDNLILVEVIPVEPPAPPLSAARIPSP